MNKTKKIIKSDGSLKQKIKELIKQVIDEITTSSAAGSGEGSAGVPRVPTWVSKNKKGRPDVATVLGYTLAKPVNEAADPNAKPPQQGGEKGNDQEQQDSNLYDAKFDLSDFESRVSQSTLQNKSSFQNKIMSKIGNKQVQLRASKGYGQPEKDYLVNVSGISIDFYYEKYVIIVKGREQGKQKESEYFVKAPYQIKILGNAVVTPSVKKKQQQQAPSAPVAPVVPTNAATKGV
jgi:hypothetical protein